MMSNQITLNQINKKVPKKLRVLDLRQLPREVYKFLFSSSGAIFFWVFVFFVPITLFALRFVVIKNDTVGDFLDHMPLITVGQDNLVQIFTIISESFFIGGLVFLAAAIIEKRGEFQSNGNLSAVWQGILETITFTFAVAVLNLIFISSSELIVGQNLQIPLLFFTFSLAIYAFYLIVDKIEKTFF